jgi:hypothetical protein
VLAVRPDEVTVVAVADDPVTGVSLLDDLQPAVDLAAHVGIGEVVTGEDRAHRPAELLQRDVGGCLGPPRVNRRRTCSDSAVPSRSAVAYLTIWSYC